MVAAVVAPLSPRPRTSSSSSASISKFLWATEIETEAGLEIRCTLCNKVFMKPNRKRKYDAVAFERHEETEKHVRAATAALMEHKQGAIGTSMHSLVLPPSLPASQIDIAFPPSVDPSNQCPLLPLRRSIADATWECFLQIVLRPVTLQTLGQEGVRAMLQHFKQECHRASLQALVLLSVPHPECLPSPTVNRPNIAKFLKMYKQLVELSLFDAAS
ncbi:Aste57867_19805 [Aphanomyces stellatus]|uniref:Aste57867_19805 protein n=1 Tax=Aphanomyces stellatus TaxID=120398 RepID=A0A485LDZ9_9STRA|nr:hypothetical protein As57867_019740 [Aphanomyces stellatus]VFT96503.1 Aste57867_19805 [Aphanomyces stellatus]